jgi:hypothetical protein
LIDVLIAEASGVRIDAPNGLAQIRNTTNCGNEQAQAKEDQTSSIVEGSRGSEAAGKAVPEGPVHTLDPNGKMHTVFSEAVAPEESLKTHEPQNN